MYEVGAADRTQEKRKERHTHTHTHKQERNRAQGAALKELWKEKEAAQEAEESATQAANAAKATYESYQLAGKYASEDNDCANHIPAVPTFSYRFMIALGEACPR